MVTLTETLKVDVILATNHCEIQVSTCIVKVHDHFSVVRPCADIRKVDFATRDFFQGVNLAIKPLWIGPKVAIQRGTWCLAWLTFWSPKEIPCCNVLFFFSLVDGHFSGETARYCIRKAVGSGKWAIPETKYKTPKDVQTRVETRIPQGFAKENRRRGEGGPFITSEMVSNQGVWAEKGGPLTTAVPRYRVGRPKSQVNAAKMYKSIKCRRQLVTFTLVYIGNLVIFGDLYVHHT